MQHWLGGARLRPDGTFNQKREDTVMRRMISFVAPAALLLALSIAPAAAQVPPPGNVNPGSMRSGAEETGAPNQPRSFSYGSGYYGYGYATSYGVVIGDPGYSAYAAQPGVTYGPFEAPNYGSYGTGGFGGPNAIGADD